MTYRPLPNVRSLQCLGQRGCTMRRQLSANNIAPIAAPFSNRSTARSIICWRPTGSGCSVSPAQASAGPAGCHPVRDARRTSRRARGRGPAHRRFRRWLDDARIAGSIRYRRVSTRSVRAATGTALAHWFNHQTHHRGQLHALDRSVGQAPELDLLFYQRRCKPVRLTRRSRLTPVTGRPASEPALAAQNAAKLCIHCHQFRLIG